MKERGISVWLVGLTPDVLAAVRRSPFGQAVGQERMFFNLDAGGGQAPRHPRRGIALQTSRRAQHAKSMSSVRSRRRLSSTARLVDGAERRPCPALTKAGP